MVLSSLETQVENGSKSILKHLRKMNKGRDDKLCNRCLGIMKTLISPLSFGFLLDIQFLLSNLVYTRVLEQTGLTDLDNVELRRGQNEESFNR